MALFKIEEDKMPTSGLAYYKAVPDSVDAGTKSVVSPIDGSNVIARKVPKSLASPGIIDVYNTFDWTASPINNTGFDNIAKPPFAKLTEYRLNDRAVINSLLYYVQAFGDQIGAISNTVAPNTAETIKNLANTVRDAVLSVGGTGVDVTQQQLNRAGNSPWMRPYDNLYLLDKTDFEYYLPYFENDAFAPTQNTYSDLSYPGVDQARAARDVTTKMSQIVAPGQYIEAPKLFTLSDASAPSYDINFPLLNTISFESAVRNYQFLWLLMFQNTPQRVTKSVVEMPRMYDIQIPGVGFLKYAYIQSMTVNFIGVRRRIIIPMPACPNNPSQVEVIMPDAYSVKLSVKSLIMNANNMMLENWRLSRPQ